jgi:hypothetical protein
VATFFSPVVAKIRYAGVMCAFHRECSMAERAGFFLGSFINVFRINVKTRFSAPGANDRSKRNRGTG